MASGGTPFLLGVGGQVSNRDHAAGEKILVMRNSILLAICALASATVTASAWAAGEKHFTADCLKQPTAKCVTAAALSNLLVIDTDEKMAKLMMPSLEGDVVRALAAAGSLPKAYEYAESLDDPEKRQMAFVALGHAEAHQKRYAQARELFDKVDIGGRTGILGVIAEEQAGAGDIANAKKTVDELIAATKLEDSKFGRALSITRIAELMQQVGDHRRAVDFLEQARRAADDPSPVAIKNFYMTIIAKTEVRILGTAAAVKTARDIPSAYERSLALIDIVGEAEDSGKHAEVEGVIGEALRTTKDIDFALSRIAALGSLAELQAQLDDLAAAEKTLAEAMAVAESMKEHQQDAFGLIASSQARVGNAKEALAMALRIRADGIRVPTLLRIAIALGKDDG